MRPHSLALSLILLSTIPALAAAVPLSEEPRNKDMDEGKFTVRVRDKVIGAETFAIEARADSINCSAESYRTRRTENGEEGIRKVLGLSLARLDWTLKFYQSEETFRGETLVRGIVYDSNDTGLTVFREVKEGHGEAVRLASPPGRLFVLDPGLYSLFDVMCIYLRDQTFESRPLNVLSMGERDTVIEVQVNNLGAETIRWGARPVSARKLQFIQGPIQFEAWADTRGRMLRLSHAPSGLIVERVAPAIKRRAPAKKPAG